MVLGCKPYLKETLGGDNAIMWIPKLCSCVSVRLSCFIELVLMTNLD